MHLIELILKVLSAPGRAILWVVRKGAPSRPLEYWTISLAVWAVVGAAIYFALN